MTIFVLLAVGCNEGQEMQYSNKEPKEMEKLNLVRNDGTSINKTDMQKTIRDYFDLVDAEEFDEAFQLFSDNFRKTKNFNTWSTGYKDTYSHTVGAIFCEETSCTFSVTATENRPSDLRKTDYTFYYGFITEGGRAKIDSAKFISQSLSKILSKKEDKQLTSDDIIMLSSVKIFCLDNTTYDLYQGSGTLVKSNVVVSNYHVRNSDTTECGIFLSDENGLVNYDNYYEVIRTISKDAMIDYWVFEIDKNLSNRSLSLPFCSHSEAKLGDKIKIYGYPGIGGGNLTITDGLLSSYIGGENDFMTSAKIDHGNSGGTAINTTQNCFLGIPTASQAGEIESLGYILNINNVEF